MKISSRPAAAPALDSAWLKLSINAYARTVLPGMTQDQAIYALKLFMNRNGAWKNVIVSSAPRTSFFPTSVNHVFTISGTSAAHELFHHAFLLTAAGVVTPTV